MKAAEGRTADGPAGQLVEARAFLLKALARIPADRWSESPSPSYSPVGWHLGHVAATQARWLLPGDPVAERFGSFFDPVQTAKPTRGELPSADELRAFLAQVLDRARERLRTAPPPGMPGLPPDFLVRHVAQHELQHAEHVQVIAALLERRLQRGAVLRTNFVAVVIEVRVFHVLLEQLLIGQRRLLFALFDQTAGLCDDGNVLAVDRGAVRIATHARPEAGRFGRFERIVELDVLRVRGSRRT